MDLFTPVVPQELQHPNFRFITKPGFFDPESKVLKNWADGFEDRDGKFVKEFQTTFNSSFWELYLFACFKELNCKANLSHSSPDFVLTSPYGEFIAEATTANHPQGHRPEWDKDQVRPEEAEMDDILRLSTLRLLQAVTEKFKKFKKSYSKLTHVQNKPFVICVTPFDQPFFFIQDCLAIIRVLYAYDQPLTSSGTQEGELFIVGESRKYQVQKKPNSEIDLGLFTNENMADVSAIIFNNKATICKVRALAGEGKYPVIFYGSRAIETDTETGVERFVAERPNYQETLLDGCHVLFNPFAKHPLDRKLFEGKEIALHNYDPQTHTYQLRIPNGFLYQRGCTSISGETEEALNNYPAATLSTKTYEELPPEIWPEEKLYEVGKNGLFSENHMGHYRGWTILVSLDSTDQDWSALAVNTLCYSYPNFREVYSDDNIASTSLLGEWLATKEEAYTAIKCKIDEIFEQN
ncbi:MULTISPECIES: hypothetical protein [unclassified Microcoleus]|uniref:hypothetical protein n=1 Tax=unclassified Microcoleus TaxID=2642155 RepID=UPI002FD044D4